MAKQSKRQKALTEIDREKFYGVDEAISLVKGNATAKFDVTVEVALNLGVDPRRRPVPDRCPTPPCVARAMCAARCGCERIGSGSVHSCQCPQSHASERDRGFGAARGVGQRVADW